MSVTFNLVPFGEGRFKLAYKGTYTEPPSKRGKACVVKRNKESYVWNPTRWDMTLKIYEMASTLAMNYNLEHNCTVSIEFTGASVYQVLNKQAVLAYIEWCNRGKMITYPGAVGGHAKLECVIVEDYIPGNFTKWCNNYGYISTTSELMPAFMHWSWVNSGGKMMIADLQGVRDDSKFVLTDPAILSNTVGGLQYGSTDTGVEGIALFFLKHTCNQFCRGLSRPTLQDLLVTGSALLQLNLISTSTAYSHEVKIPESWKERMVALFPAIAART